jgi:hypothetical protein
LRPLEDRTPPATFTVNNTSDVGTGSLRNAITQANATASVPDVIQFDPSLFASGPATISLLSSLPTVTDNLTIVGPGPGLLTVQPSLAAGAISDFTTAASSGSGAPTSFSLSGMTVVGANFGVSVGSSSTTLTAVAIRANAVGVLVANGGSLSVLNSTIDGNKTGGGIWVQSGGSLLLANSTISGNTGGSGASGLGGGVYVSGNLGAGGVTIRNCTISGNQALSGGGIGLKSVGGTVLVQNSTIVGNSATLVTGNGGGGIAAQASSSTLTTLVLESTIVAANTAYSIAQQDLVANSANLVLIQADHCLIGVGGALLSVSTNNLIGTTTSPLNPLLTPLSTNGGPTQTLAPYPGSPVIDYGSNPANLTTDQTGAVRVQGAAPDIGAVEHTPGPPLAVGAPLTNIAQVPGGMSYQFTVTYYAEAAINTATLDGSDLLVAGTNGFNQLAQLVGLDDATSGSPRIATYQFVVPTGPTPGANDGTYVIALQSNQVFDSSGAAAPPGPLGSVRVGTFVVSSLAGIGPGTLRDAITQADALASSADTIVFEPALFASGPATISLLTGLPSITNAAAVIGPGSAELTVKRDPAAVFDFAILNTPTSQPVALSGVTVAGGTQAGLHLGSNATLSNATLTDITVTGSSRSPGVAGGGIDCRGGRLTLRHCSVVNNVGDDGGGIFAQGVVDIEDSNVTGNSTNDGGSGGGIFLTSGILTVRRSTIVGNSAMFGGGLCVRGTSLIVDSKIAGNYVSDSVLAYSGGGGIAVEGGATVTVQDSTVSGNTAGPGTADSYGSGYQPALGGGIRLMTGSTLVLIGSTVAANSAVDAGLGAGGGIYFGAPPGSSAGAPGGGLTIGDSTIVDNFAPNGGGIGLGTMRGGTVLLQNSTVTGNSATSTDTTAGYGAGGLSDVSAALVNTGPITLQSTIVAGNASANGRPDLANAAAGVTVTADHSLLGAADTVTLAAGSANNLTGTAANPLDPKLAALADNGGPSWTCALLPGSPALNAGSNPANLNTDQRGQFRAIGVAPDIGAHEYVPIGIANVQVNDGGAQRSVVTSLTVTFSGSVSFPSGTVAAAFQLTHVQTGDNVNLAAAVSANGAGQTVVTLTFLPTNVNGVDDTDPVSGQNGGQLSLADGRYQLTVLGSAVTDASLGWALDGDGDGTAGGNFVSPADNFGGTGLHLYRLFGDATGDGLVDLSDLTAFRGAYNSASGAANYLAYLDANSSGAIDLTDLQEFGKRFNHSVFV